MLPVLCLSLAAFLYGYFEILNMEGITMYEQKLRIQHGILLMNHMIMHGWPSARIFHYNVLRAIEQGNLSWDDEAQIHMISMAAAQESLPPQPYV